MKVWKEMDSHISPEKKIKLEFCFLSAIFYYKKTFPHENSRRHQFLSKSALAQNDCGDSLGNITYSFQYSLRTDRTKLYLEKSNNILT